MRYLHFRAGIQTLYHSHLLHHLSQVLYLHAQFLHHLQLIGMYTHITHHIHTSGLSPCQCLQFLVSTRPEKVDECSKRLAKLTQKTKTLVQMIKDFEGKNRPVIITIGPNSYQFGTENITDFDGQAAKGMYANLISGDPIEELEEGTYTVDSTNTRVALKNPVDLLQSELARVRKEITLVTAAINEEITPDTTTNANPGVPGTDET